MNHTTLFLIATLCNFLTTPLHAEDQAYLTRGYRLTALPLAGFSSDDGPGYGFRLNLFRYDGQTIPYHRAYALQFFFTTKGKWAHRLKVDLPNLGPNQRFEIDVRYDKEDFANYFAELTDREIDGYTKEQQTFRQHYPTLGARWIRTLNGPWRFRTGFIAGHTTITPNDPQGGLLRLLHPPGADGGTLFRVHAALRYDTRDNYLNGSRGFLEEFLVEYGYGEGGRFNGGQAWYEHRHFLPLTRTLTLAQRGQITLTWGDVPFYEQPKLGSSKTVRGLAPARKRGEGRILINNELRWQGFLVSQSRSIYLGSILFADIGQIFKHGPSLSRWELGAGAGLRMYWFSTIMRMDLGRSKNHTGLYMRFAQTF
ncbi:MAG: BamA/TamA family outer membrane protein [bacterium]|nr:BamA/TamA family outer membrane protein [bacterium]